MKKTKSKGDQNRSYHFKLGLIAAISFVLASFDWADYAVETHRYSDNNYTVEDVIFIHDVQQVEMEKPKAPLVNPNTTQIEITTDPIVTGEVDDNISDKTPNLSTFDDDGEYGFVAEDPLPKIGGHTMNSVEIAPYYLDCENVLDRKSQGDCSYSKVRNYIQNVAVFPQFCIDAGISGQVWVEFTVSKTGEISDVIVIRSVHSKLDKAAVLAVQKLPKMQAGSQSGHKVDVKYQIPVDFIIKH